MLFTVGIPIGVYHEAVADEAIASAKAQTMHCDIVTYHDMAGHGAGYARNRILEQVTTPFITFLDADDILDCNFLQSLVYWYQRGKYVYCDDMQDDLIHTTPDRNVYLDGSWHAITTLLPTAAARHIGGFNEDLPALEDLDFYLRLQAAGVCGVRCPQALLHYTGRGQRAVIGTQHHAPLKQQIYRTYAPMCNCGSTAITAPGDEGRQDGDILAVAMYTPRAIIGAQTGRIYARPRGHNGNQLWVSPDDLHTMPGMWRPVPKPEDITPAVDDVLALAAGALR